MGQTQTSSKYRNMPICWICYKRSVKAVVCIGHGRTESPNASCFHITTAVKSKYSYSIIFFFLSALSEFWRLIFLVSSYLVTVSCITWSLPEFYNLTECNCFKHHVDLSLKRQLHGKLFLPLCVPWFQVKTSLLFRGISSSFRTVKR